MEIKTARLTLLIDPNKKAALERLCAQQDRTASQVVRQLIREYLALHGVAYTASGSTEEAATAARVAVPPVPKAGAKRPTPGRGRTGRRKA
jgi:hypothetical protein